MKISGCCIIAALLVGSLANCSANGLEVQEGEVPYCEGPGSQATDEELANSRALTSASADGGASDSKNDAGVSPDSAPATAP
jgi:hypothetical protein